MPAEIDVVEVRSLADTEYDDELVLAAIKRTLASIRLDPDDDVQDFAISQCAGFFQTVGGRN